MVLSGTAAIDASAGPAPTVPAAYLEKYRADIERIGHTPESFAESYPLPVRISLTRLRGH